MGRGEATPASSPYPPTSTRLTRRNVVNRVGSTILKQDVRALWKIAANDLIGIGDSFEVPGELGGFLLQSVKTGQLLGLYGSVRINEAALGAMSDRSYVYTANVDDGKTFETIIIDGTPGDGPGSYLNMSFTQPANVGIQVIKNGKSNWRVHMIALMDGEEGEEALGDYGPDYWLPWLRAEHPLTPRICDAFRGAKTAKSWLREYLARTADITCPYLDNFSPMGEYS